MSASLVGSEMCIRDSHQCNCKRETARKSAGRRSPHASGAKGPTTEGAVSYTHLTLPTICSV
eukprot:1389672-Alexandrium_andersonii.AAC.1